MPLLPAEADQLVPAALGGQERGQGDLQVRVVVGRKAVGDHRQCRAVGAEVAVQELLERGAPQAPGRVAHLLHESLEELSELDQIPLHGGSVPP